jgi:hypothetical protein
MRMKLGMKLGMNLGMKLGMVGACATSVRSRFLLAD